MAAGVARPGQGLSVLSAAHLGVIDTTAWTAPTREWINLRTDGLEVRPWVDIR